MFITSSLWAIEQDFDASPAKKNVVIIPVSGNVDPGMAAFIGRAIRDGLKFSDPVFILEMDTFGGRVDAALQIVDTLLAVPDTVQTIAFVQKKAISAGALIALACNKLTMKPNTTIGDCAPIALSNEGPQMLGEKFQSPLRAKFRALAKRNGYSEALSESMVSAGSTIYKITTPDSVMYLDSLGYSYLPEETKKNVTLKTIAVPAGELLTMNDAEAKDFGFSSVSAPTVEEMLEALGISGYELVRIEENWSEAFVRFIGTIAPILIMIGFAALYTELKSPGFGVPGIIGIICLAVVFAGQYIVGLADYTELLLIALGIILLALELFVIPGFGIAGVSGLALLTVGMILSFQGFVIPRPEMPWQMDLLQKNFLMIIGSLAGSFILFFIFFRFLAPYISAVVPGPYLTADLSKSHIDSDMEKSVYIGDKGVVTKPLRPTGSAEINGRIYDVITEGEFIEKSAAIVVTEIRSNKIVVRTDGTDE